MSTVEHRKDNVGIISFNVEFRALKQSRIDELLAAERMGTLDVEAFIAEAIAGWSGLSGGVSAELVYDATNLAALCDHHPGMAGSILRAHAKPVRGKKCGL